MKVIATGALVLGAGLLVTTAALANGANENGSWQFRTANERQVLLNIEQVRLQLTRGLGVGSASGLGGLGTQTGNAVSVTVSGSNNVLNLTTTNSGAQNISGNTLNN